ncbi:MAG: hypothetical protein IJ946_04320 [Clostridia bacterium]|nr:hypothetical protein [Clostridia bacterium]
MLQYEIAKRLYDEIKTKAKNDTRPGFDDFYNGFLKSAVSYAETRTEWNFMELSERMERDRSRSIKHDSYMSSLGAVCRNLGIEGIDGIMPDRKAKGDFACYIALFLALEQR